jgi:hypothetical protein
MGPMKIWFISSPIPSPFRLFPLTDSKFSIAAYIIFSGQVPTITGSATETLETLHASLWLWFQCMHGAFFHILCSTFLYRYNLRPKIHVRRRQPRLICPICDGLLSKSVNKILLNRCGAQRFRYREYSCNIAAPLFMYYCISVLVYVNITRD